MEGALFTREFDIVRLLGGRYQTFLPSAQLCSVDEADLSIPLVTKTLIKYDIEHHFFDNKTNAKDVAEKYTESFSDGRVLGIIPTSLKGNTLATSGIERKRIRGAAVHAFGDYSLTCPTIMYGNYLVKSQNFTGKLNQYRLTYANKQSPCYDSCWCNATHYDDIPLCLGFTYTQSKDYTDTDRYFSTQIMKIWTDFAKNGEPGTVNGNFWPPYTKNDTNGDVNLQYIELHPDSDRFGRIFTNGYDGIDELSPSYTMNCKNYWDKLLSEQFGFD